MTNCADCLLELQTEELPPKALFKFAQIFSQQMHEQLNKINLAHEVVTFFATPRRLAIYIKALAATQPAQMVERKGPALAAAFDEKGNPTPACMGFARSCGITPKELMTLKTPQGEWIGYKQQVTGKSVNELLPPLIEQVLNNLPIPKRMRWGIQETQFVRPIHSIVLLYGDQVIKSMILNYPTDRVTHGHRFHAKQSIQIKSANDYVTQLKNEGHVIADFAERRKIISEQAKNCIQKKIGDKAAVLMDPALMDEVTGLVEWPTALIGQFDATYLTLPREVLISAMQDHQRYFPVVDAEGKLLPYFIAISNIESKDAARVVRGYERVLKARLSDAVFFYQVDQIEPLAQRVERLKQIVFQAKLGTLYDKAKRLTQLSHFLAKQLSLSTALAERAGLLAKTDLTTQMVSEFPELQGIMGDYYARLQQEDAEVAIALREQYLPRFAGDQLPIHPIGQVLALADRIDTLVATFGISQIPTGDKDPFGLRRAALGIIRNLIENKISLDLKSAIEFSLTTFDFPLTNKETTETLLTFIQERLRSWYQDQGVTADILAAVTALGITNPLDMDKRIKAVQTFKQLQEAEALSVANKRVSNILAKLTDPLTINQWNPTYFENAAEQELARQLEIKSKTIATLTQTGRYDEVLLQLAELRQPIDDFFDHVMVMTEDKARRDNRILLLRQLRALFLQVADIALLQP